MSVTNNARTAWTGDLFSGSGTTTLVSSGAAELAVSWKARSEGSDSVTTPEELLAAAHASCFAMALSKELADNGTAPQQLDVSADVTFVPGKGVTTSVLNVSGSVSGLDQESFASIAAGVKDACPVSQALAGVDISLGTVELN